MKSTGQILREARLARKLDIAEVAKITRIRPRFLELLESDDFSQLPNGIVAKGFIKNYGQFLGLNPNYLLAVFRRDFVENRQGQIVPRGMIEPVTKSSIWSPKSTVIAVVVFLFTVFLGYLAYQYALLVGPPFLTVNSPQDNITTSQTTVEVYGKTDPEATISVNEKLVALDKGGQFSVRLELNPGLNKIVVTATNKSGKNTVIDRRVFLTSSP
jgi:cytoskeletal protein RodZ